MLLSMAGASIWPGTIISLSRYLAYLTMAIRARNSACPFACGRCLLLAEGLRCVIAPGSVAGAFGCPATAGLIGSWRCWQCFASGLVRRCCLPTVFACCAIVWVCHHVIVRRLACVGSRVCGVLRCAVAVAPASKEGSSGRVRCGCRCVVASRFCVAPKPGVARAPAPKPGPPWCDLGS